MNIVILTESYFPVINGVSASTRILASGLRERGHSVTVIAPANAGASEEEGILRSPSVAFGPCSRYPLPAFWGRGFLRDAISRLKPQVLHAQIPFLYGMAARSLAARLGLPLVAAAHTLYPEYVHYIPLLPRRPGALAARKYMASFYNSCAAVATPSEMMRRELEGYGVTARTEVIPTGIELPGETRDMRPSLGIAADAQVLVYMSRVAREKNLDMLLDAFALISPRFPRAVLLVVGGGPYLEHLRARAENMGLGRRTIFTGMVDKSRVYDYLSCGDIFVFPSVTETQGLAVCEAQAAGLPVAAVRAGGVPEFLEEGGTALLAENDSNDFARITAALLEDPEARRRMSQRGRSLSAGFSTEAMIDRYEEFYSSVLK